MNWLIQLGQLFKLSTKLPIPVTLKKTSKQFWKSMKFFPVVGMVIGIILLLIFKFLYYFKIFYSPMAIVMVLLIVELILTGGIHFQGLASTFDSIFKYRSKQKMLDNMKEIEDGKGLGTSGCLIIVVTLLFKLVLLADGRFNAHFVILIMPVLSRLNCVINCFFISGARSTGIAKSFCDNTKASDLLVAVGLTVIYFIGACFYINVERGSLVLVALIPIVVLILGFIFGKWMEKKIGGITWDTLGATIELSELVTLLAAYILSSAPIVLVLNKLF